MGKKMTGVHSYDGNVNKKIYIDVDLVDRLCRCYKSGDIEAANKLYEHIKEWISSKLWWVLQHNCWIHLGQGYDREDFYHEAYIQLIKFLNWYNPDYMNFWKCYKHVLMRAWFRYLLKTRRSVRIAYNKKQFADVISLDYTVSAEEDDVGLPALQIPYYEDYDFKKKTRTELVDRIIDMVKTDPELRTHHKQMFFKYFGLDGNEPRTMESVGREMGVTREAVRQIREKILRKLRFRLEREGYCISDVF
jgi:RNA polymerase sigma factor (sigma-70 family)